MHTVLDCSFSIRARVVFGMDGVYWDIDCACVCGLGRSNCYVGICILGRSRRQRSRKRCPVGRRIPGLGQLKIRWEMFR